MVSPPYFYSQSRLQHLVGPEYEDYARALDFKVAGLLTHPLLVIVFEGTLYELCLVVEPDLRIELRLANELGE